VGLDKNLLNLARQKSGLEKIALVPSDAAAQAMGGGGAPPMDPAMMGGGGAPPMDPAMMGGGGAPPMDPAMMAGGGAPPPGGMPPGGDITSAVTAAVQQAMQSQGGGQATGANGKPAKPDINMVATDVFQIKKLLYSLFQANNWPLPPGILDGPGRDPNTGAPSQSPDGSSGAGNQSAGAQPQSSISPIEPMQGAFPSSDESGKSASDNAAWNKVGRVFGASRKVSDNAKTAAYMFRRRRSS